MAYEHREGSGSLFRNTKKEEGSSQPDMRGDVLIGGVLHEVAAWSKVSDTAGKWLSLNIKPKQEQQKAPEPRAKPATLDSIEDDLPF